MSTREKTWWWIAGVLILLYCLFPIAWIVSLSFKGAADIANKRFLPTEVTGENYSTILTGSASELFLPALRNSFGICLIATFISCLLSMFAAYAIARLDFPGKRLILSAALGVAIFPVISIVTPLFNLWRQIGLYDTWLGLIIPYLSLTLPISIWTMSAFFREIPWEMEQAAQVDGATWWQRMWRVTIPNMKAAIMVALLFRTLDAFRIFDSIFVMTAGANGTESVSFLAYRQTISRVEIGLGSAVSVLLFLAVVQAAGGHRQRPVPAQQPIRGELLDHPDRGGE